MNANNGNVTARYTHALGIDEPLAMFRGGATYYYHADGLGSITSLTDAAGAIVASYPYDSFGNLGHSTGTVVNPFRYTGREWDSEAGLYFYRARYYDPATGRFLSEDPIGFKGGINFYPYVGNSVPNFSDPSGQFPRSWHRDQTYRLARDVFGPNCADKAETVADANAAVDDLGGVINPWGSGWAYGGPHFPVPGYPDTLVDNAINTCDLDRLGRALHSLQDGYAHPPGPLGPLLHMLTGTLIYDYTGGANALAALGATRTALQDFKEKCLQCCTGGSDTRLIAQ